MRLLRRRRVAWATVVVVAAMLALWCLRPRWVDPCPNVEMAPQVRPLPLAAVPPGSGSALLLEAIEVVGKQPSEQWRHLGAAIRKLRAMPLGPGPVPDPPGYGTPPNPRPLVEVTDESGFLMGFADTPDAPPPEPSYTPFDRTHSWTVSETQTVETMLAQSRPALDLAAEAARTPGQEGIDFDPCDDPAECERLLRASNALRDLVLLRAEYAQARGEIPSAAADLALLLDLASLYQRGRSALGWTTGESLVFLCTTAVHRLAQVATDPVLAQMLEDATRAEARRVPLADVMRVHAERLAQLRQADPVGFWHKPFRGEPLLWVLEAQPRWGWLVGSSNAAVERDLQRFQALLVRLAGEPYDAEGLRGAFDRLRPRPALLFHRNPLGYILVAFLYRSHVHPMDSPPPGYEYSAWGWSSLLLDQAGTLALLRSLRASLAARRHALRQGHAPAALGDLVPEFLPAVPTDPFTLQPLRYERDAAGRWRVFSLGQDQGFGGDDDVGWGSDWSASHYAPPRLRGRL